MKVVWLSAQRAGRLNPPSRPRMYTWYSFLLEAELTRGHSEVGRIMSMKNFNDTVWNRTCAVPQTIKSPRKTILEVESIIDIAPPLFILQIYPMVWPGSSVGIATDYGLEDPGSNPGGDEIFLPSRPALGPNQHPVKCVSGLSLW